MKAAAYTRTGGPDVLEYVDVPDPELRPGGIILAVESVSIQGGEANVVRRSSLAGSNVGLRATSSPGLLVADST